MSKPLTYISLFSSAGVGCYGFKMNGFECIATNELLEKRLKIQKYNKKCKFNSGYILGDITNNAVKSQINDEISRWRDEFNTNVDVVIATPPCQGMSVANHKKKHNEIERNSLVVQSIQFVVSVQPKFFVFENVKSFLNTICTDIDHNEKTINEAIQLNLGGKYNILSKVVNFKEYGSHSSRTRTLVIGVRKDIHHITPYDLFPKKSKAKTLRELFSSLPKLNIMGEISSNDIYHSYREFDKRMLPWIENLKEGESAFQNTDLSKIPHQIKNGEIVYNKNKNGDKYSRWYLDREGPCIHTRNDILASQSTIHPIENRVFSVRELMLMMSIPTSFKWTAQDERDLNALTIDEKKQFLKKEELNIRHCIGEAVPTAVLFNIAENIKDTLSKIELPTSVTKKIIEENNLSDVCCLCNFIERNFNSYPLNQILQIAEYANSSRAKNAAYFTRSDIAFSLVNSLPDFKNKKSIRILEPSVGIGNFIPLLIEKYSEKENVVFDLIDIDQNSLTILKLILTKLNVDKKFKFNFINVDFLLERFNEKYDLIVGNPPYGKVTSDEYIKNVENKETKNIFSYFIEKSFELSNNVAFIVPKSLINAPEFNVTRKLLLKNNISKIIDYGEKAFKGVKIETISFVSSGNTKSNSLVIESYITEELSIKLQDNVFSENYPYWLLYRNQYFDDIATKMKFDVFKVFRDRQITKVHTKDKGLIRVLKSRNVGSNQIIDIQGYDSFIDNIEPFSVKKFLDKKNIVMIPNLTYKPRATFLPKNMITDGSVALLTVKDPITEVNEKDLEYYGTVEFERFYRIARNYGTRSLNIDNNAVFFFGLLKE